MITNPFEGSIVSLFVDPNSIDPQQQLERDKELILNRLGHDREHFLLWLSTINIKSISTIKLETLELLVNCWTACVNKYCHT